MRSYGTGRAPTIRSTMTFEADADPLSCDFAYEQVAAPDTATSMPCASTRTQNPICPLCHLDAILCMDRRRQEDQVEFIWSGKGDEFGLTKPQRTSGQHYATVDGNEPTVLDNNRDPDRGPHLRP